MKRFAVRIVKGTNVAYVERGPLIHTSHLCGPANMPLTPITSVKVFAKYVRKIFENYIPKAFR